MPLRKAALWTAFYVSLAFGFAGFLYATRGPEIATLFLAGYAIEESLSIDNLMVFTAIFSYWGIAREHRFKVLYWGIFGAVFFRAIFVGLGSGALLLAGPYIGIVFGLIVIWSAIKMLTAGDGDQGAVTDYNSKWFVRLTKTLFYVTYRFGEGKLFVKSWNRLYITPLFLCLVTIEISDILFSFDSVPAVIAVVQEPLIVYASVMFAVLGLRSMYFILDAMLAYLKYLGPAVIALLFFVGAKLTLSSLAKLTGWPVNILDVSPVMNLSIVMGFLTIGVMASLVFGKNSATLDR